MQPAVKERRGSMQFQSIDFLIYFLPLFLLIYYIFPTKYRNFILLTGSIIFYCANCAGNDWWIGIAVMFTGLTFLAGRYLFNRRWLLTACLSTMAGVLIFFKLYDGGRWQPAGMSFYLFQMAAYLIDVYRGKIRPEDSLVAYGAKTLMFPKLLSGPLVQLDQIQRTEPRRRYTRQQVYRGYEELILGHSMKVLLADRLGGLWAKASVVGYESMSTPFAWIALCSYALRLYLDFFGYSLMAVGLGRMLGFQLPRNFQDPYAAKTISEFYRRWHMTLGRWFREYLYFPLGGSRKGTGRTVLNLALVWLFTGLWHGTGANYLVWAGILVFFIIMEKLWLGERLNQSRFFCHGYVVLVILLSWVPFAVSSYDQMVMYFGRLLGIAGKALNPGDYLLWCRGYSLYLAVGVLLATPYPEKLWLKIRGSRLADCLLLVLFWLSVFQIATAEQNPFLYFQY